MKLNKGLWRESWKSTAILLLCFAKLSSSSVTLATIPIHITYDGYTEEEGRSFRYPLTYDKKDNEGKSREYKTRSDLSKYNPYAIGSNQ